MMYSTCIDLHLNSQYTKTVPVVVIRFDQDIVDTIALTQPTSWSFITPERSAGTYTLQVEFFNKDYTESKQNGHDMMVGIDCVTIENYPYNFSLHSTYRPDYPKPWAQQQVDAGVRLDPEVHSNYLGWNGIWNLEISFPIYRWIHQTTKQGWLI